MTITVANTSNTSTFEYWLNRTNELASAMTNYAVTTDSNTATGNAAITGSFTADSLLADSLLVGNSFIKSGTVVTTGNSAQNIDSFSTVSYRTAEYIISVKDNTANNYYSSKLLVTHDDGNAYITEYAMIVSNSSVGTFSATIASSNVLVQFTPTPSNTTVKFAKVIL